MKNKVLIFGGNGFIGSHVAEAFQQAGFQVTIVMRSACAFIESLGATLLRTEDFTAASLVPLISGNPLIVNCTADVRPHQTEATYRKTQVVLTRELLQAAQQAGATRFMQLSTIAIYGSQPDSAIMEEYPAQPQYALQRSCWAREQLVREFTRKSGMEHVILRPAGTFGKRSPLVAMLLEQHRQGFFPLIGHGNNRFSMIDTRDIGRAFVALARLKAAAHQTFLVKGYDTTWHEIQQTFDQVASRPSKRRALPLIIAYPLATLLEVITPRNKIPFLTRYMVHSATQTKLYSDQKIRQLGFVPAYSLQQTVQELFR